MLEDRDAAGLDPVAGEFAAQTQATNNTFSPSDMASFRDSRNQASFRTELRSEDGILVPWEAHVRTQGCLLADYRLIDRRPNLNLLACAVTNCERAPPLRHGRESGDGITSDSDGGR